ncbi:MAG: acyl-CoA thioesterase [Opitutaceae bacterium]|nr:acyl-CoA thioesterase [Cytophagales bacterium]
MELKASKEIVIRFNEADMLQIVWHGHYVNYFEEGRQAFGEKYGLGYLQVYEKGFSIPIVKLNVDYKRPLKFGDTAIVEAVYVPSDAAKLIFKYTIKRKGFEEIVATGETTQVFLSTKGELSLIVPDFFHDWKLKFLKK